MGYSGPNAEDIRIEALKGLGPEKGHTEKGSATMGGIRAHLQKKMGIFCIRNAAI